MQSRWARLTRGLLAAVFSTVAAAVSHTLAGGAAPGALALAVTFTFAAVVCVVLTGKPIEEISKDVDRDKILTAQQAVEYGLVDEVLDTLKVPAI